MLKHIFLITLRFVLRFFFFLPVKTNQILFKSFAAQHIACNPLYIFKELEKSKEASNIKFIWVYNKTPPQNFSSANVIFIKEKSFAFVFANLTSKIIITNHNIPSYIPFRKNQIVINTWHGGGAYKKVFASNKTNSVFDIARYKHTAKKTTYFISSSNYFSQTCTPAFFIPENKLLPIGMPRNDIFFNPDKVKEANEKVRNFYNIKTENLFVLYAPTFRGVLQNSFFKEDLNFNDLIKPFEEKFNKKVTFAFRGHYSLKNNSSTNFQIDASDYPDMQELLCAADILITDYSSSMWDFSLTKKPVFIYANDLQEYINNRGFYNPPEEWGFPIAQTIDEFINAIASFNENEYKTNIDTMHKKFGSFDQGTASKSICKIILNNLNLQK